MPLPSPLRILQLRLLALTVLPVLILISCWVIANFLFRQATTGQRVAQDHRQQYLEPLAEMGSSLQQMTFALWETQERQSESATPRKQLEAVKAQLKQFDEAYRSYAHSLASGPTEGAQTTIAENWESVSQKIRDLIISVESSPPELRPNHAKKDSTHPASRREIRPARLAAWETLPAALVVLNTAIEDARRSLQEELAGESAEGLTLPLISIFFLSLAAAFLFASAWWIARGIWQSARADYQRVTQCTGQLQRAIEQSNAAHQQFVTNGSEIVGEIEKVLQWLGELSTVARGMKVHARDALLESHAQNGYGTSKGLRTESEQVAAQWSEVAQRARKTQEAVEKIGDVLFQLDLLAVNLTIAAARQSGDSGNLVVATETIRQLTQNTGTLVEETLVLVRSSAEIAEQASTTTGEGGATLDDLTMSVSKAVQASETIVTQSLSQQERLTAIHQMAQNWKRSHQAGANALEQLRHFVKNMTATLGSPALTDSPSPAEENTELLSDEMGKVLAWQGETGAGPRLDSPPNAPSQEPSLKVGNL